MLLVKVPFLGGHPHAEYWHIQGSRLQFSNWSRYSLLLLNQGVFHFHRSWPLVPGLSQFNLTSFRYSSTKTLCALPYVPHALLISFHSILLITRIIIVKSTNEALLRAGFYFFIPRHPILNRPQSVLPAPYQIFFTICNHTISGPGCCSFLRLQWY
jgi:hypothetical protein